MAFGETRLQSDKSNSRRSVSLVTKACTAEIKGTFNDNEIGVTQVRLLLSSVIVLRHPDMFSLRTVGVTVSQNTTSAS